MLANQLKNLANRPGVLALTFLASGETLVWAGVYYVFPALLVRWEADFDWTRTEITFALMLATIASALASPFSGRLIDHGKGPALMATSAAVAGVCVGLTTQVNTLGSFYALWILIGVMMSGCLYEPCFALITLARGAKAKSAITVVTLVAGFASTLSFPSAHALSEAFGWRAAAWIFSVIVIFGAAPLLWFGAKFLQTDSINATENPADARTQKAAAPGGYHFLKNVEFWLLASCFAFAAIVHGVTLHHMIPLLSERGFTLAAAVTVVSFIGPMQVAGRVVVAALGNRISNHATVLGVFGSMGLSILVLIVAGIQPWLLVIFIPLFGGGYGIMSIIRPVIAREVLGGNDFGSKSGVLALVYLLGAGSAPWLGSIIWRGGGYSLVLPVLLILMVTAVLLYLRTTVKFNSSAI